MLAALGNGVKGGKWFSLIDKVYRQQTLQAAWHKVKGNAGAAGVDGQSVKQFGFRAEIYLAELEQTLRSGEYRPEPIRRVEIAKAGGKKRPLGIPAVKDRIVQTALKLVIEPIFEREFEDCSYGFRPQRGCKDALREVDELIKQGYTHVVDADLESYFDTIPHTALMRQIEQRISDGRVLELIGLFLSQDIIQGMKRWTPTGGTPQGAVISPLLANIYLHPMDRQVKQQGYRMVRYADDCAPRRRGKETARSNGSSFAAREMRAGPSGSGCRTRAQTTGCCFGPMIGVVSETEKAGPTRQVRAVKTNVSEPSMTCRKRRDVHRNRAPVVGSGQAREKPADGSSGDRHEDGVSTAQALVRNVGTFGLDAKRELQVVDP
jgi:retron-type reverse transcriptase